MDIVDTLLSIEQSLTLWVSNTSAQIDDQRAQIRQVIALRDKLARVAYTLLQRKELPAHDLDTEATALTELAGKMAGISAEIAKAKDVINIVQRVIAVASTLAGIITAVSVNAAFRPRALGGGSDANQL
jgi:hypothetical protein